MIINVTYYTYPTMFGSLTDKPYSFETLCLIGRKLFI